MGKAVLSLFRWVVVALALPFVLATATDDILPAAGAESLHAVFSVGESKLVAPAKPVSSTKRITAALEDGPEDEEPPVASFVRSYDGDDQIPSSAVFALIAFDFVTLEPDRGDAAPLPSHFPCAGFPTGPPAV